MHVSLADSNRQKEQSNFRIVMANLYTVNPSFFNMAAESLATQLNKDIYQQSWWDLGLEEFFYQFGLRHLLPPPNGNE